MFVNDEYSMGHPSASDCSMSASSDLRSAEIAPYEPMDPEDEWGTKLDSERIGIEAHPNATAMVSRMVTVTMRTCVFIRVSQLLNCSIEFDFLFRV